MGNLAASIRDITGQGNAAIYIRLRDSSGNFWNFSTLTWVTVEVNNCRQFLTEYTDSDTIESRYLGVVVPNLLPVNTMYVIEYVYASNHRVLAEEQDALNLVYDIVNKLQFDGSNNLLTSVTSSSLAAITSGVKNLVVDGYSWNQILSVLLSVLAGVTTNNGLTFKTPDGMQTRVTAAVDPVQGNRTSITITPGT